MASAAVSNHSAEQLTRGRIGSLLGALFLGVALLLPATSVLASTWRVPEDFLTIREALNVAQPCDVVLVGPGTYAESLFVSEGVHLIADGEPGEVVVQPEGDGAGSPAAER